MLACCLSTLVYQVSTKHSREADVHMHAWLVLGILRDTQAVGTIHFVYPYNLRCDTSFVS